MVKLKLPFELEKPSPNEYVTQASEIGYEGGSLANELSKTKQAVDVSREKNIIYIIDSSGNVLAQFDSDGLKVVDVKTKISGNLTSLSTLISNKVDKMQGKELSSNDYTNEEKAKLANVKNLVSVDENSHKDSFYVCDKSGNIIFLIDSDGVHSSAFICKQGNSFINLLTLINSVTNNTVSLSPQLLTEQQKKTARDNIGALDSTSIIDAYEDAFYITDSDGYVVFKADATGIHSLNLSDSDYPKLFSNVLYGKRIYSLCDSLGEGSGGVKWQQVVANMCGGTFVYGSSRELVSGGTPTLNDSDWNCGMVRALNLQNNYNASMVDVIFIENINDMGANLTGSVADTPFMLKNMVTPETVYEQKSSAESAFATVVSNTTPAVGTMLRLKYITNGYKITINGSTSQSGTLTVNFSDGNSVSTSTISAGSSIADVINTLKSANWTQVGFKVSSSGSDYIIIADSQDRGASVPTISSMDAGNTGLTMAQAESDTITYYSKCFTSYNIAEWNTAAKWVHHSGITLYAQYKGLLEYLQTNFPAAQIYFCVFPRLAYNYTSGTAFKRADGSLDWDAYTPKTEKLYSVQKECCEYMNVECIDLAHRCGINLYNINAYFPSGNVHPTAAGYTYLGKQIVRILC